MSEIFYPVSYSGVGIHTNGFRTRVNHVAQDLPTFMKMVEADTVVVTGTSGLCMAFALRMIADIPFVFIRKHGENAHSDRLSAIGNTVIKARRYVVLDDFVATGATVRTIVTTLPEATMVGIMCYNRRGAFFVRHSATFNVPLLDATDEEWSPLRDMSPIRSAYKSPEPACIED
jgi:orotate phosphoribosyltransferase